MALVDLKSDLSWYSAKGEPRGYRPNPDKQSTDFVYNDDLTLSARPKGFDNAGFAAMFPPKTTANEFQIDNTTTSFRGTARRMNQLGEGTRFPIGPLGQVHKFDLPRLGFNPVTKYEEVYGPLSNSGLADTYTLKSPIDDMYNKFKVRDEAFNRGNIREPFILRGIQRDDNSDPQRFVGSNSPVDIPRGGILTSTERTAIDVARISKFLATTQGLNFITKQSTLALMNPNIEGADGEAQGKKDKAQSIHINSTKLFTPANTLAQIGSAFTGLHVRKLGLSPVNIQDTILNSPPMEYEKILTVTRAEQGDLTNDNRLVLIYRDLIRSSDGVYPESISKGTAIPQLTAPLGPTALSFDGGIGDTTIRRWSVTIPTTQQEIPTGTGARGMQSQAGSIKFSDYQEKFTPFNYNSVYTDTVFLNEDNDFKSPLTNYVTDDFRGFKGRMFFALAPNFADASPQLLAIDNAKFYPNGGFANLTSPSRNTDYDAIQVANDLRKGAGPGYDKIVDFRAYSDTSAEIHGAYDSYAKEQDTTNKAGRSGRQEFLLSRLREDGKEGNRFDGVGDSFRGQADNSITSVPLRDPVTGFQINFKPTEDEYTDIGAAASETLFGVRSGDTDFRYNGEEKYQPYQLGAKEEIGNARQSDDTNTDGINNLNKPLEQRNPAKPVGTSADAIFSYRTLAYDDITTVAANLKDNKSKINYNRKQSGKTVSFWDGVVSDLDRQIAKMNQKVDDGELITFKFNSIVFQAYIDQISDNFSPGFSPEPDQNRADPRYLYTSFERKIQLSFKVVYEKSDSSPWSKLKSLADLSLPKYGGGPWAQRVDVTIGSLYKGVPMLIESVSYDWDNETPWSLEFDQADNHNGLPMYTQVQLGLIYMGNVKAAAGSGYVAYG